MPPDQSTLPQCLNSHCLCLLLRLPHTFFFFFGSGLCFSVNRASMLSQIIAMPESLRLTVHGAHLAFQSFCLSSLSWGLSGLPGLFPALISPLALSRDCPLWMRLYACPLFSSLWRPPGPWHWSALLAGTMHAPRHESASFWLLKLSSFRYALT